MKRSTLVKAGKNNDIFFTLFMAFVWSESILMPYVRVGLQSMPFIWRHADLILSTIYILLLAFSMREITRSIYIKEMGYLLLIYAIFYLYYFLFDLNRYYYAQYSMTSATKVFPMFLVGICVYRIHREQTIRVLYWISMASVYMFAVYMTLFAQLNETTMRAGDMNAAYNILPHICMSFTGVLRKPKPLNIGAVAIGGVFLLFLGNRGSILCLGVFIIAAVIFSGRLKKPWLFLLLSALVMAILFLFGVLDLLYEVAEKQGFSLRIFQKLESGEIASESGRDRIRERILEYIMLYPMMGMGIYADRRVAGGFYAHSLILEILIHYGLVLGILILAGLVFLLYRAYLHISREKNDTRDFFLSLLFSYVFKLFLSSSYLMEPYFFFVLGFSCAAVYERKEALKLARNKKERERLVRLRTPATPKEGES